MLNLFQNHQHTKPNFIYKNGAVEVAPTATGKKAEALKKPEAAGRELLERRKEKIVALKSAKENVEKISVEPKEKEAIKKFAEYLKALNNKYFDLEYQKARLSKKRYELYKKLSEEFKAGMDEHMRNHMELIFEDFEESKDLKTLKKDLEYLKNDLPTWYEENSDKAKGIIGLKKLEKLRNDIKPLESLARVLASDKTVDEKVKKIAALGILEAHHWKKIAVQSVDVLKDAAIKNGSDTRLIEYVKGMPNIKKEEIRDLDDAIGELKDRMKELAEKTSIRKILTISEELNNIVNKGEVDALKAIDPPSMKWSVREARRLLLIRRLEPWNIDDEAIVNFMRADIEKRKITLRNEKDRQELFQAIRNVETYYEDEYDPNKIPKETREVKHRPNPDRPTKHDRIARAMAMIALAKESKWIIGNIDENLGKALEKVEPEEVPPKTNFKFRDVMKLYPTEYISMAERQGFTGAGLAKSGLKLWAVMTVISNVMAARKDKNWESLAKNPWMYIAGGTLYGLHKVNQNPEMKDYFKQDKGGKERIATQSSLISLAEKYGRRNVEPFIRDPREFIIMRTINPKEAENLVKLADDRKKREKKKIAVLTIKDLEENAEIKDKDVLKALSKQNDRMRYLFYKTFLQKGRNIRELKENCDDWAAK